MTLHVSCACPIYDRIVPLYLKQVIPEGMALNFLPLSVEEIFWRQARHAEFDISECSLSTYTLLRSRGDERFIAIPVFTSRVFRHSCVFINKNSGIKNPQDLKGKTVGVPEYQITAVVWLRGIFQDAYGVSPADVSWRTGGEETPGRAEKVSIDLPDDIRIKPIGPGKTLATMLESGEIDALFSARIPSSFYTASGKVARLFENYRDVEETYFTSTGIFPIMHLIVLKQDLYQRHPWIAVNLYKAFCRSKQMITDAYLDASALRVTLPWMIHEVERTRETFLRYHHEQGLSKRRLSVEELFAAETLDAEFKI
jgi:4,5-dihydroxyphthalate decarboxylase